MDFLEELYNENYQGVYVFKTQFDAFFCCEGRIIVNPGAKCKIIWEGSHPRMYFLRTHNFLPYSAVYLILKEKNYYLEKDCSQNFLL